MKSILNFRESPYGLFFLTALLLLIAVMAAPAGNIDFLDKTMFGVPMPLMVRAIPLLLICFGLLYVATRKCLYSRVITWIHVLTTVALALLLAIVVYIGISPSPYASERHELIGNAIQMLTLLFVFGQLVYLINVLLGVFANRGRQP